MIVGLIQMRCEKAAIAENLARIGEEMPRAASLGADVVVFPEMSITGYADPKRYPDAAMTLDGPEVARFLELSRGCGATVLAGLIEVNPGHKPFITQLVAREGTLRACYRKRTIIDEEAEWFSSGDEVVVFDHEDITCGVAICADIENESVFRDAWDAGAEVVLHAAAPGLYGEQSTRNWETGYAWWEGLCNKRLGDYARDMGCWIAVATQAGRTVDEDFPGGAFVFDPSGRRVYATPDWTSCSIYLDLDLERHEVSVVEEVRDGS